MLNKQRNTLLKSENPSQYAEQANKGLILLYPVKINGQDSRSDNGILYHSTVKEFDANRDHVHKIHELAKNLPMNPPDAKNTQIETNQFKDRNGSDVYVISLKGNSAEKMKEHHGKFAGMGLPEQRQWEPHISVDKKTWNDIKNSGARTAHEAGIEFGNAELKKGPQTLKTYRHEPDTTEPRVPDEGDISAKIDVNKSEEDLEKSLKHIVAGGLAMLGAHNAHAAGADLHSLVSGIGKIPGVKVSAKFNPYAKNGRHGEGNYRVNVGKYSVSGEYNSNGAGSNHHVSFDGPKDGGPHDPDYQKAKYLKDKLSTVGTKVLERSDKSAPLKPLMKPYVSLAQERWAHTPSGEEALGGKSGVHEWDEATKGKKLPEKVSKSDKKVCMTKPAFVAEHKKLVNILKHPSKKGVNEEIEDQSKELKEEMSKKLEKGMNGDWQKEGYEIRHEKTGGRSEIKGLREAKPHTGIEVTAHKDGKQVGRTIFTSHPDHPNKLYPIESGVDPEHRRKGLSSAMYSHAEKHTGKPVIQGNSSEAAKQMWNQPKRPFGKSEQPLEKGALKNAGMALGMAAALAGAPNHTSNIKNSPDMQTHQNSGYDHGKMLRAIASVESSGGKNINHTPTSQGTAYGRYALMPNTITDTIKGHKDLKAKYGKALSLKGPQLHRFMEDNKGLEDTIADRHLAHIEHNFKNNPDQIAFSWNQGISGTKKNKPDFISNHPYVKKIRDAYGKEK